SRQVQAVCVKPPASKHANPPHSFALLREHNERPASRRTNNQCDERAPPHCLPRGSGQRIVAVQMRVVKGCSMSALGQKQTYAVQNVMSALPPKATSNATRGIALGQNMGTITSVQGATQLRAAKPP